MGKLRPSSDREPSRSRQYVAGALSVVGFCLLVGGVALVYPPAAVILAGVALTTAGLLGVQV